ncbi:sensor histidine kinase [Shouchella patagoniensis]|uniref:sensor histidine kinase n=1 Tax=Shouchella patagoniensis TaxID=228576 RepID=UPI000994D23F|nr:HAMP domain-containing sensor histidine kinase [Shouchella patagoniensis]
MNIKNRITVFSTVFLLLVLLLANGSIYFVFQKVMRDEAVERTVTQMDTITEVLHSTDENLDMPRFLRAYLPADSMIRVISQDNASLLNVAPSTSSEMTKLPAIYREGEHSEVSKIGETLYTVAVHPIIWENGEVATLELVEDQTAIANTMRVLQVILTIATLIILIPSFLGGRVLSKLIVNPIVSMIQTMEEIQKRGTFKHIPLEQKSNDELAKMAQTFNRMMDLLEANYNKQEQFVSDASHELKTPLTVVESYAKLLKRWGKEKPDVLDEAVEAIYSEAVRMKEMTQQMLLLAKDESQFTIDYEKMNITSVAKEAARNLEKAFQRSIVVEADEEEISLEGDAQKLKQVFFILLDNAIKYSSEPVNLSISRTASGVQLDIKDKGEGIPADEVDKVYDRFYRVDKSRTRETGGSGLGLPIAKRIVEAHHGKIKLSSVDGIGTTVTVHLPLNPHL